jgi:hypothetical protein
MQIKQRGMKVVCIRTEYIPEKKRTVGKQVASQDSHHKKVTPEVEKSLLKEDAQELQNWLDARSESDEKRTKMRVLSQIKTSLERSTEALSEGFRLKDLDFDCEPEDIFEALDNFRKAFKRAGYKRSQKPSKAQSVKSCSQGSLIAEKQSK